MVERRISRLQPGNHLFLKDFNSQVRDGSYCLQPGERLSWKREIPETDHCGETDHWRDGSLWRDGSSRLQPGEHLSLKDFNSQVRDRSYCLQPVGARNPQDGSLWRDGSWWRDGSSRLQPGEHLSLKDFNSPGPRRILLPPAR